MRHQRHTRRLMPAVLQRLAQPIVVAVLQRVHQREHPLQVEHRVLARDRRRQRRTRLLRRQTFERRRDDEAQVVRPRPAERARLGVIRFDHRRHATEQRGRRVIRVTFERRCGREQRAVGYRRRHALEDAQAGNRRRRAAAEARRHRNVTVNLREHCRDGLRCRLPVLLSGERRERAFDHVGTANRRPAADHLEPCAAVVTHIDNARAEVELDRHAKRVETAPKVGGGAGDQNFVSQK